MKDIRFHDRALELFAEGYSCSQSVFAAMSPALGLDARMALKIASTFGGGMGLGSTCGALTGAMMVLGLAAGFSEYSPEAKDATGDLNRDLVWRWQQRMGAIDCRDILQIDPTDKAQKQAARDAGVLAERCPNCVQAAVEIVHEMLHELDIL
jgi:C_GCAxxG_C_C family probable redox protein